MKRLIKKSVYVPQVGDYVVWKKHPYDDSTYEILEILTNGNVFMDNGVSSYTDIKPSTIEKI